MILFFSIEFMSFVNVTYTAVVLKGSKTAINEPNVSIAKSRKSNGSPHRKLAETAYIFCVHLDLAKVHDLNDMQFLLEVIDGIGNFKFDCKI